MDGRLGRAQAGANLGMDALEASATPPSRSPSRATSPPRRRRRVTNAAHNILKLWRHTLTPA
jgi:hypothetical protein